ncbi:DUF1015 domain-containing protein [Flavobacteriaceae bacterium]|nr:DUF1015 domain-containing protein [Flavobacteriaceae bacterium]MDC1539209.1 DUF1015 domain-containing protein [Flavobacteriaceae bacterium]
MAKIYPFEAVRPSKEALENFSSKSYKSYTEKELRDSLKKNPDTFLSIITIKKDTSLAVDKSRRYEMVRQKYDQFIDSKILIKDSIAAFYIYETTQENGDQFSGIMATASVEDYNTNIIKKHEATIAKREHTFKTYLNTVRFNAAPVLLTYSDNLSLETDIQNAKKKAADFSSWTTGNETHKLWRVNDPEAVHCIQKGFQNIPSLYIADGHHRSASSALLAREKKGTLKTPENNSFNRFLTYLIPESQLKIYDYNRVIKDLNGLSTADFLEKISVIFEVKNKGKNPYKSLKANAISMYIDGLFYSLSLRKTKQDNSSAINKLDTYILQTQLLEPILNITNVRTNKRIAYIHGANSLEQIKATVDRGDYAVGFGLFPIDTKTLMAIADSDAVMPPKSTYIYPKLRSGITIYEI